MTQSDKAHDNKKRIEVRCPVCQYHDLQFIVLDASGHTEVEIKCRKSKCGAMLHVTITDDGVTVVERKSQYPTHYK